MVINQGRYNVFNEDGTMFKWGKEKVSATVTPKNRVQFFIGDNMEPMIERHMPARIRSVNDFDKFTLSVFQTALVKYVALLVEKLHKYQEAYRLILEQKHQNTSALIAGTAPDWRCLERIQELNEFQDVAQTLILDTMGTLYEIAPESLSTHVMFIFTEV